MKAIILAAGQGKRLRTQGPKLPKCLVKIEQTTPLEILLNQLEKFNAESITIVVGYKSNLIIEKINSLGLDIDIVVNEQYNEDTNIYSLRLALEKELAPFTLFEADCVFSDQSFNKISSQSLTENSVWFTCGQFNNNQSGGIIKVSDSGTVEDIKIVDCFDNKYLKYMKMIGVLKVGINELESYFQYIVKYSDKNKKQYYHQPWIDNIENFKSFSVDLPSNQVFSFNTIDEYNKMLSFFKG